MTDLHHTTLRELARNYAKGIIGFEAYRQRRADLLHGILSGKIHLQTNNYPPLPSTHHGEEQTPPNGTEQQDKKKIELINDSTPADSPGSRASHLPAGIAALLIILATIVLILLFLDGNTTTRHAPGNTNPSLINKADADITQAKKSIRIFLMNNNWGKIEQARFLAKWSSLKKESLPEIRRSVEFGRLINAIYKRLLEEQALSGLRDTDAAINRQRNLMSFAEQLGIDDPRIKLPNEHQAATTTSRIQ